MYPKRGSQGQSGLLQMQTLSKCMHIVHEYIQYNIYNMWLFMQICKNKIK